MNRIIVEAHNMQVAEKELLKKIPEGFIIVGKKILSDGERVQFKGVGDTIEKAFEDAESRIPAEAIIIEKQLITEPKDTTFSLKAQDEREAEQLALGNLSDAHAKTIRLIDKGRIGFLGVGAKPKIYEVEVHQNALVHVIAKSKARIEGMVALISDLLREVELCKDEEVYNKVQEVLEVAMARRNSKPEFNNIIFGLISTFLDRNPDHWNFGNIEDLLDYLDKCDKNLISPTQRSQLSKFLLIGGLVFGCEFSVKAHLRLWEKFNLVESDKLEVLSNPTYSNIINNLLKTLCEKLLHPGIEQDFHFDELITGLLSWDNSETQTIRSLRDKLVKRFSEAKGEPITGSYDYPYKINRLIPKAFQFYLEGFDFQVIYQPRTLRSLGYVWNPDDEVFAGDPEILNIERGSPLKST